MTKRQARKAFERLLASALREGQRDAASVRLSAYRVVSNASGQWMLRGRVGLGKRAAGRGGVAAREGDTSECGILGSRTAPTSNNRGAR